MCKSGIDKVLYSTYRSLVGKLYDFLQDAAEFNGMMPDPLPTYSKSFVTTAVIVLHIILLTYKVTVKATNIITQTGDQKRHATGYRSKAEPVKFTTLSSHIKIYSSRSQCIQDPKRQY